LRPFAGIRVGRLVLELGRVSGALFGWLCFLSIALLWGVVVIPATLLLAPVWPRARELFATLTGLALRVYVRSLTFAKIRLEGAEKRLTGMRILVANHASRLDSPVLLAFEPRLAGPVRGYMLRVPIVGRIIRLLGFFDADTGDVATFEAMQRAVAHARERAGGLLFYPEGTRSKSGEIGPFHHGAFRAAVDHGLPIQPIVIEGLDRAYPPGTLLPPRPGRQLVRIRYLEPLHPPYGAGPRREVVRGLSARVRALLIHELARLRAERSSG
jgi:1-acyl-sn-glycerol-3-phosphate acyltransferase